MKSRKNIVFAMILSVVLSPLVCASEAGTVAGTNLLQAPSARASTLGEAYSAVSNDVGGLSYNPATLMSLSRNEASFLFEKGMIDDHTAHMQLGLRQNKSAWGAAFSYYDSGAVDAVGDSGTSVSVTGEKDLMGQLGYSKAVGRLAVGLSGKYLSSTIGETTTASTFAGDAGLAFSLSKGLRLGAAVQNIGGKMEYSGTSYSLPRIARAGISMSHSLGHANGTLLVDAPYHWEEKQLRTGVGAELAWGAVAVRAGYRSGSDLEGLTIGAGINLNSFAVDYAFGMANKLDSRQQLSLRMRFGGKSKIQQVKTAPVKTEKFGLQTREDNTPKKKHLINSASGH